MAFPQLILRVQKGRMKLFNLIAALGLAATLGACATSHVPTDAARAFAAESSKLGAFTELTQRYRDTYKREKPYLSPSAEAGERELDAQRRASYDDFVNIEKSLALYMQTLGKLAGEERYDLSDSVKKMSTDIKAWPGSGLNESHVAAYSTVTQLITRMAGAHYQDKAVRTMVVEGDAAVHSLIDAMIALLRLYDKSNDNEKKIVLGMFEVEIPFATALRDRLLSALAKDHFQSKATEYGLVERRYALTEKNLAAMAQEHGQLLARMAPAAP